MQRPIIKHILAIMYVYIYILAHFGLYNFLIPYYSLNPIAYFRGYFPIIILCIPVLYMVYQWVYFKINPKRRLLLSIVFLELLAVMLYSFRFNVETHADPFDVNDYRVFVLAGILAAFVMGVFLDIIMKSLFFGHKLSLKKIEFIPSVFKHFIVILYIYIYMFTHLGVFFYIKFDIFINPVRANEYFYIFMFVTLLPVVILYFVYQWLYLKKLGQNRKLLSILFLEFFILIEAILGLRKYNSESLKEYFLLIGVGVFVAFIMGWMMNLLMKRLFKNEIIKSNI